MDGQCTSQQVEGKGSQHDECGEGEFDFIRMTVVDLCGASRSKLVPGHHYSRICAKGMGMYAGTIGYAPNGQVTALKEIVDAGQPDFIAFPAQSKPQHLSWAGEGRYKIGKVQCELRWDTTRELVQECPRQIALRQIQKLSKLGLKIYSAFEMEFIVLKDGKALFPQYGFCCERTMAEVEGFTCDLMKHMELSGVPIRVAHLEYTPGQFEFGMEPQWGIHTTDSANNFKSAVKEIALQRSFEATFLSKLAKGDAGSGCHFNHSIFDIESGKNIFVREGKTQDEGASKDRQGKNNVEAAVPAVSGVESDRVKAGISEQALYWIGGLCKHARALTALCCPTVNCFRRLHQPWAPTCNNWGVQNRNASIRLKNSDKADIYIENRLPSGLSNSYIVLAATIAAGIDGLQNRILPERESATPESCPSLLRLPETREEAMKALSEDTVIRDVVGERYIEWVEEIQKQHVDKALSVAKDDEERLRLEQELYSHVF